MSTASSLVPPSVAPLPAPRSLRIVIEENVAIPAEVKDLAGGWLRSNVFDRSFQLTQTTDPLGHPLYVLNVRP